MYTLHDFAVDEVADPNQIIVKAAVNLVDYGGVAVPKVLNPSGRIYNDHVSPASILRDCLPTLFCPEVFEASAGYGIESADAGPPRPLTSWSDIHPLSRLATSTGRR
jgi:hypothetical protein